MSLKKTVVLFLVFAVGLVYGKGGFPPDIERIVRKGELVVAMFSEDLAPFFERNDRGELVGIDVDIATGIAKELGVKLVIERSAKTYDELVDIVASRRADIAISCLSITLKRALKVAFTKPYAYLHHAFLINRLKASQKKLEGDISRLNSPTVTIGVVRGTSYVEFAHRDYPRAVIKEYDLWDDIVKDLLKGNIDAAFFDELEVSKWAYNHPEDILYVQTRILEKKMDPIAIAVHPEDIHLLHWLNIYLDTLKNEGMLDEIVNKRLRSGKWKEEKG